MNRSRNIFIHQPAFHLMVDLSEPMSKELPQIIMQAAQNVLVLATHLKGSTRIPYFGFSVIGSKYFRITPLQLLKENVEKVLQSINYFLENIGKYLVSMPRREQDSFSRILYDGVREEIENFRSSKVCRTGKVSAAELFICLVTTRSSEDPILTESLISFSSLDGTKIQVVELIPSDCEAISNTLKNPAWMTTSFMEFLKIPMDSLAIEDYFKTWLNDFTKSKEHLHIQFMTERTVALTISCDLSEHMVNPFEIPFSHQFILRTDSTFTVKNFDVTELPIYDLMVVGRIPRDELQVSDCFGWPLILRPTQCRDFKWQENVENQQLFLTINRYLKDQQEVLLCQRKLDGNQPAGYFVIRPDEGMFMSLKSVVPRELMLKGPPQSAEIGVEPIPQIIKYSVNSEMKRVNLIKDFNPKQNCSSGFYEAIAESTLLKFTDLQNTFTQPPVNNKFNERTKFPVGRKENSVPQNNVSSPNGEKFVPSKQKSLFSYPTVKKAPSATCDANHSILEKDHRKEVKMPMSNRQCSMHNRTDDQLTPSILQDASHLAQISTRPPDRLATPSMASHLIGKEMRTPLSSKQLSMHNRTDDQLTPSILQDANFLTQVSMGPSGRLATPPTAAQPIERQKTTLSLRKDLKSPSVVYGANYLKNDVTNLFGRHTTKCSGTTELTNPSRKAPVRKPNVNSEKTRKDRTSYGISVNSKPPQKKKVSRSLKQLKMHLFFERG